MFYPLKKNGEVSQCSRNCSTLLDANSDLANDLGNLVSRTIAMIEKYFGGQIPEPCVDDEFAKSLKETIKKAIIDTENYMEKLEIGKSLESIFHPIIQRKI